MRSPNIKFWIGMCAVTLGTISLIVDLTPCFCPLELC